MLRCLRHPGFVTIYKHYKEKPSRTCSIFQKQVLTWCHILVFRKKRGGPDSEEISQLLSPSWLLVPNISYVVQTHNFPGHWTKVKFFTEILFVFRFYIQCIAKICEGSLCLIASFVLPSASSQKFLGGKIFTTLTHCDFYSTTSKV